jgi:hypothetical protein
MRTVVRHVDEWDRRLFCNTMIIGFTLGFVTGSSFCLFLWGVIRL